MQIGPQRHHHDHRRHPERDHDGRQDQRLRQRIGDKRVLALVKSFLKAGVLTTAGTREGTITGTLGRGIYDLPKALSTVGGKWVAVPWSTVPALISYRKSWFDEIGVKEFPKTWAAYHEAGKKLKAAKRPIGQTLGHTFGDAPTFEEILTVVASFERRFNASPP